MLRETEDADIHPVALAIWMCILALVKGLPATIASIAIRKTGNLRHDWAIEHYATAFTTIKLVCVGVIK